MSKKNYLLIDNGHGLAIIDITSVTIPLCVAVLFAINTEKELMAYLQKSKISEVWRVYALIETSHKRGMVTPLFKRPITKGREAFIRNTKNIGNCGLDFK